MKTDNMHLPKTSNDLFHSPVYPGKEWVMDPPPFIIDRLSDRLIMQIYSVKLKHMADLIKNEIKAKEIEAKMYLEIAGIFAQK